MKFVVLHFFNNFAYPLCKSSVEKEREKLSCLLRKPELETCDGGRLAVIQAGAADVSDKNSLAAPFSCCPLK